MPQAVAPNGIQSFVIVYRAATLINTNDPAITDLRTGA